MNALQERSDRLRLMAKIQDYDGLIAGYYAQDIPKSETELKECTLQELKQWLNLRMTRYQYLIDNEIFFDHMSCQN